MALSIHPAWSDLPDSALTLLAEAEQDCLFCGDSWFRLFSREVAEQSFDPCWLLLGDDRQAELVLPMMRRRGGRKKILRSMSNYYTPYFSPVGGQRDRVASLHTLLESAADSLRRFDSIEFFPLTAEVVRTFDEASRGLGFSTATAVQTYNWREAGICSFDRYWATRDSRLRNTVKRKRRKLDAEGGFAFSIAGQDDVERCLQDYRRVYGNSWKTQENYPEFIDGMIRAFAERGQLRLGFVHHDGTPVAAQIWLISAGNAYIYKLAYDEQYASRSLGTLLTHFLFRHAVEVERVHTVDYLTGDDPYKAQWMSERRPLYRLIWSNPRRPRGAVQAVRLLLQGGLHRGRPAR
ncbi:MAG: GNAT family N-acetyltransferase [Halieaceae bacterium]|jgi:CelD/BcsL family acetyltransferase involved in cellulose biosynthesis|nr:GNAT family N-acetyltransferase [Halieaceae bacterium]